MNRRKILKRACLLLIPLGPYKTADDGKESGPDRPEGKVVSPSNVTYRFTRVETSPDCAPVVDAADYDLTDAPVISDSLDRASELDPGESLTVELDGDEQDRLDEHVSQHGNVSSYAGLPGENGACSKGKYIQVDDSLVQQVGMGLL